MTGIMCALAGGARTVNLEGIIVGDVEFAPTTASASLQINRDGTITKTGNGSSGDSEWHTPSGGTPGDDYFVSLTLDSGDTWSSGAAASGVGIALTADRAWSWSATSGVTKEASATLRIARDSGMTEVVGSSNVTVTVESAL